MTTSGSAGSHRVRAALLVYVVLWVGAIGVVRVQSPDLNHGAHLSDADVWNANVRWERTGLAPHAGIPVLVTHDADAAVPGLYVTYPPGPFWIFHLAERIGLDDLRSIRTVPLVVSAIAVVLAFLVGARITGSEVLGLAFAVLFSFHPAFAGYADSLHQMAYTQATLLGAVYAWLRFESARTPRRRRAWLAVVAGVVFVDAWLTLEHVGMFVVLLAILVAGSRNRRRLLPAVPAVAAALILAAATRLVHLRLGLGGWDRAIDMLLAKAALRTGASSGVDGTAMLGRWLARLGFDGPRPDLVQSEFLFPILSPWVLVPALGLVVLAVLRPRGALDRPSRAALAAGLAFTVAGLHWFAVMREHAFVHRHVVLLLVPGGALVLTGIAGLGLRRIRDARGLERWGAVGLCAALASGFALELRCSEIGARLGPTCSRWSAEIDRRDLRIEGLRALGRDLRHASHVHVVPAWEGDVGALLDVPFHYDVPESRSDLAEGGVLVVELQGRVRRDPGRLRRWVETFGEPEVRTFGATEVWVFRLSAPRPRDGPTAGSRSPS